MRCARLPAENEQILEREIFAREDTKSGRACICFNRGALDAHASAWRRAGPAATRFVVDDPDAAIRLQRLRDVAEEGDSVVDLGVHVDDEDGIERPSRQI